MPYTPQKWEDEYSSRKHELDNAIQVYPQLRRTAEYQAYVSACRKCEGAIHQDEWSEQIFNEFVQAAEALKAIVPKPTIH